MLEAKNEQTDHLVMVMVNICELREDANAFRQACRYRKYLYRNKIIIFTLCTYVTILLGKSSVGSLADEERAFYAEGSWFEFEYEPRAFLKYICIFH